MIRPALPGPLRHVSTVYSRFGLSQFPAVACRCRPSPPGALEALPGAFFIPVELSPAFFVAPLPTLAPAPFFSPAPPGLGAACGGCSLWLPPQIPCARSWSFRSSCSCSNGPSTGRRVVSMPLCMWTMRSRLPVCRRKSSPLPNTWLVDVCVGVREFFLLCVTSSFCGALLCRAKRGGGWHS